MICATNPFSFILFGASGHLAKLKIYPALYTLASRKRLPDNFAIVGFSRSEMNNNSFKTLVEESIRMHVSDIDEDVLSSLLEKTYYQQGQYNSKESFEELQNKLNEIEKPWDSPIRIGYLSVPPSVFPDVLKNMCAAHIHADKENFRCIVEKPVGNDLKSGEEIYKKLRNCFDDKEIFFLDHFLGKEAVRNAYFLRHANPVLERLFKNTLIHHVEITASESVGIEGRSGYFDNVGTFRDMVQSHLLLTASLLTMRLVENFDLFRAKRQSAMEQLYLPPANSLDDVVLQGQYTSGVVEGEDVIGYLEEEGISKSSRTNTYAAIKLLSRTSRWQGVPFYLKSGKRLDKKETRVSIQFQETSPIGEGSEPNRLDIILQGEAGMRLHLQTKVGGTDPSFRPLIMEDPLVCIGDCLPEHGLLLLEVINGNQQWFLSFDEVKTAWNIIDPLQKYLDNKNTPLYTYKAGTSGPEEANKWIKKDNINWF